MKNHKNSKVHQSLSRNKGKTQSGDRKIAIKWIKRPTHVECHVEQLNCIAHTSVFLRFLFIIKDPEEELWQEGGARNWWRLKKQQLKARAANNSLNEGNERHASSWAGNGNRNRVVGWVAPPLTSDSSGDVLPSAQTQLNFKHGHPLPPQSDTNENVDRGAALGCCGCPGQWNDVFITLRLGAKQMPRTGDGTEQDKTGLDRAENWAFDLDN